MLGGTARHLHRRRGEGDGAMAGGDHAVRTEAGGDAQQAAEVVRVLDPVEDHHQGVVAPVKPVEKAPGIDLRQGVREEHEPLVPALGCPAA